MVERIIPKTEALAERERKAIEDMSALFPDGNVSGLDTVDKQLGKRLSALYVALGYDSRSNMIKALGFRQERTNVGRPITTDPEAIMAELAERYEGMEKPKTVKVLIYENPDLKGPIKTIQNRANELYGHTLVKELKSRGLIDGGVRPSDISEEDIREMLDALIKKYANAPIKPSSMSELKAENPESKETLKVFSDRCRFIYGVTPRKKLINLGIFGKSKDAVIDTDEDEVWHAVDELAGMVFKLDDKDKPKTLIDLQKAYPEQGEYIKAGKKKGFIDKGPLQEIGVLAPTRFLLRREGVRRATVESLVKCYTSLARVSVIKPRDSDEELLPPNIAGIDVTTMIELREITVVAMGASAAALSLGDKVPVDIAREYNMGGESYMVGSVQTMPESIQIAPRQLGDGTISYSESELAAFMGGEVVSVSHLDNFYDVAQIRVRYLAELNRDTLAYILRQLGVITEKDIRGSMEWRYRLGLVGSLAGSSSNGSEGGLAAD